MMMLTSCLDGGSNERQRDGAVGVVRFNTKNMKLVIESPDFYPYLYYGAGVETQTDLADGDCVVFGYTVDFSSEANANYQTSGIVQGTVTTIARLDQFPCTPYLIDTAALMEQEVPVAYAVASASGYLYLSDKLFLVSNFSYREKQQIQWHLYYDPALPAQQVEGKNIYTLFLRATVLADSNGITQNTTVINTFNAENFFSATQAIEKNQGKDLVYFKISHIKEINEEDSAFTWTASDLLEISIPQSE
jgi:hypothetical protein